MSKITGFFRRILSRRSSASATASAPRRVGSLEAQGLVNRKGLEFFNSLSGCLEVQLSEPARPVGTTLNVAAPPEARVLSIRLVPEVFDDGLQETRPLTEPERAIVVLEAPEIRLRGESGDVMTHSAPDRSRFTVRDLLQAAEETERRTRPSSQWLGGVDVHHVFFEGIEQGDDGVWEICWGS